MQSEELQLLCSLGREAAEILWEMAAYQKDVHEDTDASTREMLEKGELLKVAFSVFAEGLCNYWLATLASEFYAYFPTVVIS